MTSRRLLTITEAAKKLKVSSQTLRRWDTSGKFKSKRHPISNYRVYNENEVLLLVKDLQLELAYSIISQSREFHFPYFETKLGKLYNTDSIKFLKGLHDNSIDLIFADPPYNIKKAEWDTFASQKEYVGWSMKWIVEARRVLKSNGSLFICVLFRNFS